MARDSSWKMSRRDRRPRDGIDARRFERARREEKRVAASDDFRPHRGAVTIRNSSVFRDSAAILSLISG